MSKPFHWFIRDPWIPGDRDSPSEGTQEKHVTFALDPDPDQISPRPRRIGCIIQKVNKNFEF